ncbi:MAG: hypothetical protein OMM_10134 [Candidatus Magnetoglobus multicellularis str. Araruama]|uniref:Uncharacterized protein n=1 Tax=Candidatus Magnetoglobus multicellularis str. Araruama TaxID=890399 RepID=A0A1V1P213_9BACT|nr:MAG: hypothetical protein OMM_10134 [Candidatus Magnetoglobus multicellularis str. Araruama]
MITFNAELDKIKDESVKARKELMQLKETDKNLSNHSERKADEPYKVRQKDGKVRQKLDRTGKISGWNVRKAKDGYYRCYRKIKRKVHCIYIGKKLDRDKAMTRIKEKEDCLRLDIS